MSQCVQQTCIRQHQEKWEQAAWLDEEKEKEQKDLARSKHLAKRSSQVLIPRQSPEEQRTFLGPFEKAELQREWGVGSQGEETETSVLTIYGHNGLGVWALEALGCNGNKPVENQIRWTPGSTKEGRKMTITRSLVLKWEFCPLLRISLPVFASGSPIASAWMANMKNKAIVCWHVFQQVRFHSKQEAAIVFRNLGDDCLRTWRAGSPGGHQGTVFHFSPWAWWFSSCVSLGLVAPIGVWELRKRSVGWAYSRVKFSSVCRACRRSWIWFSPG